MVGALMNPELAGEPPEPNPIGDSRSQAGGRLFRTFRAFGVFQVIYFLSQIGAIPLLIGAWGRSLYGEWILLAAVPAYLTVADLGFGFAVANDVAIREARGDREGALASLHSAWVVVCALCLMFCLGFLALIFLVPFWSLLHLSIIPPSMCRIISAILMVQVLLAQIQGVVRAPLRCDGNYVHGVRIKNFEALGNLVLMVAVAMLRLPPVALAAAIAAVSIWINLWFVIEASRRVPYLRIGFKKADLASARAIAWPAFTQNLIPLSTALSIQGMLVVIGFTDGPVRAAQFSTTRTLTRVITQVGNSLQTSFLPEISLAWADHNLALARRLHHRASQLSFWMAVSSAVLLRAAGPFLYVRWTRGKFPLEPVTLDLLLLALVFTGVYFGSLAVPLAMNRHSRASLWMLGFSLAALPAALQACRMFGISGVAGVVATVEFLMIFAVVPFACRLIDDRAVDWFTSMTSPDFRWLIGRLKHRN